jgi:hypothetical protein
MKRTYLRRRVDIDALTVRKFKHWYSKARELIEPLLWNRPL